MHLLGKPRKCHRTGEHTGANLLRHSQRSGSSPSLSPAPCHPPSCLPATQCKSGFAILQMLRRNISPCANISPCIIQPSTEVYQMAGASQHRGVIAAVQHGKATPSDHTTFASTRGWEGGISARLSRLGLARAWQSREWLLARSPRRGRGYAPLGIPSGQAGSGGRHGGAGSNGTQCQSGRPQGASLAAQPGSEGMVVHSLCTSSPLQPSCRTGLGFQSENMAEKGRADGSMDIQKEGDPAGAQTWDQLGDTHGQVSGGGWMPARQLVPTYPTFC